jgi:hypothetical protein
MTPGPLSLKRVLVYAAIFGLPWVAIVALVLFLAGCAAAPAQIAPVQITGEATAPPRAAVYRALGTRDPAFAYPACYDFAFAAFDRMREAGQHPLLVAALTETGEGHMLVALDGIAFDNRYPRPVPIYRLPYALIEASGDGVTWHKIAGAS